MSILKCDCNSPGIQRDKTIADKLMRTPNDDTQITPSFNKSKFIKSPQSFKPKNRETFGD